jgi:hypothetical protein
MKPSTERAAGALARLIAPMVLAGALSLTPDAHALDQSPYPDWKGEWMRFGSASLDPEKPPGLGQQIPLKREYQTILEASLADQAAGGQGNNTMGECIPPGMPRTMIDYAGMEFIVTPETTYLMLLEPENQLRRIYTDGRNWPDKLVPSSLGYSIGKWVDEDGNGRYDTLMVETRAIKVPHIYDGSGAPFHKDGEAVIKERITTDKTNRDVIHDDITIMDHALTRPWSLTRSYQRVLNAIWIEINCIEDNHQVRVGNEHYYVSGDGYLMPTRKNQPPPDLSYFKPPPK